jgi:RNA polymerase sigma factor FliA
VSEFNEKEAWIRYKEKGDAQARDDLIVHYMRIVRYVAGRMAIHVPSSVEMDDLVGWGIMGLMDAVEKFDHTQDIKFTTYASIRIRGAIIDQIRTLDWAPRSLRSSARKMGAVREKLRHQKGKEPTLGEIAEEMGLSEDQADDIIAQMQTAQVLSLNDYLPSDEEGTETRKMDVTANAAAPSPDQAAVDEERKELLVEAILALPDQQQKVLNLYYYEELTLKEIGMVLDVTESRICQIHGAAMKKLRKVLREKE